MTTKADVARVQATLIGVGHRGANARPALEQTADVLMRREEQWWDSGGEGTWPPLADETLRQKAALGQPAELMVATGKLRASLTRRGAAGQDLEVTESTLRLSTTLAYAAYASRRRPIAAPPSRGEVAEAADEITSYVMRGPR